MFKFARSVGVVGSTVAFLSSASRVFAQTVTETPVTGGGEGTASSLPNAGTEGYTYIIFGVGALLFIYGMLRLALSYREVK